MKPEHENFKHMNNRELGQDLTQEMNTLEIRPPEDEAEFMKKMSQVASGSVADDQLLEKDEAVEKMEKKRTLAEKLVLLGQPKIKSVAAGGMKFRLKLINVNERTAVYKMVQEMTPEDQITKAPLVMTAAAIFDVDGEKLESYYNGSSTSPIEQRFEMLCEWDTIITNKLADEYDKFSSETAKEYDTDFFTS